MCGADRDSVVLVAHHVKSWREHEGLRFDPNNGTVLCLPCHTRLHAQDMSEGRRRRRQADRAAIGEQAAPALRRSRAENGIG